MTPTLPSRPNTRFISNKNSRVWSQRSRISDTTQRISNLRGGVGCLQGIFPSKVFSNHATRLVLQGISSVDQGEDHRLHVVADRRTHKPSSRLLCSVLLPATLDPYIHATSKRLTGLPRANLRHRQQASSTQWQICLGSNGRSSVVKVPPVREGPEKGPQGRRWIKGGGAGAWGLGK